MRKPRFRKWLILTLASALTVVATLVWLNWEWDSPVVKARFREITIGMPLGEAEQILGMNHDDGVPEWVYPTADPAFRVVEQEFQEGPHEEAYAFYTEPRFRVILAFDPATRQVVHKQLLREPTLLEWLYSKCCVQAQPFFF